MRSELPLDGSARQLNEQLRGNLIPRLHEQVTSNSIFQLQEQMRSGLIFQLQEELRSNPILQLHEQIRNNPILQLQEQMRSNPILQLHEQLRSNSIFQLQEQLRSNPILQLHEQIRSNSIFQLQEQLRTSPILQLHEQIRNNPIFQLQEQISSNRIFQLQEQIRGNPFFQMQESVRNDLFLRFHEKMSLQFATALAVVAEQDKSLDGLLANDSDQASIDPLEKLSLFVTYLYETVRDQIQATRSVSELFKLHNLLSTILSAAALYYAIQSANTEDVDKLRSSVDLQTDVIRQEASASRLQMQKSISELSTSIQQMMSSKATEFGSVAAYRVKRSVPVKATKSMRSETVGVIYSGEIVLIVGYEKKWVRIETIDPTSSTSLCGWVVKKNLRRIK